MKGLAVMVLFVAGLASCLGQGCPSVDPMDHTVHLPHPSDCNMFLRCDHGIAKPERCPSGLHFNPKLQVCDWPEKAGCTSGSEPTAPPTEEESNETEDGSGSGTTAPPPPPPTEEESNETEDGSGSGTTAPPPPPPTEEGSNETGEGSDSGSSDSSDSSSSSSESKESKSNESKSKSKGKGKGKGQ